MVCKTLSAIENSQHAITAQCSLLFNQNVMQYSLLWKVNAIKAGSLTFVARIRWLISLFSFEL